MKAVRFHSYGGPEVLTPEDVPTIEPGPDDVLIEVAAAGVNPLDWKIRSGALAPILPLPLPFVPGWDVAGIVAATGAQVRDFKPGDAVFGMIPIGAPGAYAEQAVVPASALAAQPLGLKPTEAAAIPVVGLAAHQLVNGIGDVRSGQSVLVLGAAGNVGRLCVGLAAGRASQVWAAARASDLQRIAWPSGVETLATDQDGSGTAWPAVDLVIDTVGGALLEAAAARVRPGGRIVSTVQPPQPANGAAVETHMLQVAPDRAALTELGETFSQGHLPLPKITTYPLSEAAQAHAAGERGQDGKLVLVVP